MTRINLQCGRGTVFINSETCQRFLIVQSNSQLVGQTFDLKWMKTVVKGNSKAGTRTNQAYTCIAKSLISEVKNPSSRTKALGKLGNTVAETLFPVDFLSCFPPWANYL